MIAKWLGMLHNSHSLGVVHVMLIYGSQWVGLSPTAYRKFSNTNVQLQNSLEIRQLQQLQCSCVVLLLVLLLMVRLGEGINAWLGLMYCILHISLMSCASREVPGQQRKTSTRWMHFPVG